MHAACRFRKSRSFLAALRFTGTFAFVTDSRAPASAGRPSRNRITCHHFGTRKSGSKTDSNRRPQEPQVFAPLWVVAEGEFTAGSATKKPSLSDDESDGPET